MNFVSLEARRLLAASISSGGRVDGSIGSSLETDSYTLHVDAGAAFVVAVHDTSNSGFKPRVRVLSPSNTAIYDHSDDNGIASAITTNASGTYTVNISAAAGTGSYSLIAFRNTANLGADNFFPSNSGRRFAKTVGPGDVEFFTLDATTGQSMVATVAENTPQLSIDPHEVMLTPDGRIVGDVSDEHGVRLEDRAGRDGRFFVVVTDAGNNDTGILGVSLSQVPGVQYSGDPDTAPLASGVTRTGDLPAGDMDVVLITNVGIGDTVAATLSRTGGSLDPDMVLYAPDGSTVTRAVRSNGNATTSFSTVASQSGTYWVLNRDFEADDGGTYSFRYDLASNAPVITNRVLRVDGTEDNDTITVGTSASTLLLNRNGSLHTYTLSDLDRIEIFGGGGGDKIDMSQSTLASYVSAGSGDDIVHGGSGSDSITGGAGRNRLYGGNGNDRLNGSNGHDVMFGEADDDRLYGQGGDDDLDGGGGQDRLYGGDGNDMFEGGSSNDRLYGDAGNDTLVGGRGNDQLDGGDGTDRVNSREDGDTLISIESA